MRNVPVLFLALSVLILTCGCSGPLPEQSAPTPATVMATTPPDTPTLPVSLMTPTRTASVSDNTIRIVKNTFQPADMTVPAGSTVRWLNTDDRPHRIEFEDKTFTASTFLLGASQSASQRFDSPGTYNYSCMIHPGMKGTITVEV